MPRPLPGGRVRRLLHSPERRFTRTQRVALPIDEAFARFTDVRHLAEITPPFLRLTWVTDPDIHIEAGTLIDYRIALWGVPCPWQTRVLAVEPPERFVYEQAIGPLQSWWHAYAFAPDGEGTLLTDEIAYRMGRGLAGRLAHRAFAERAIHAMFDHRAAWIAALGHGGEPTVQRG